MIHPCDAGNCACPDLVAGGTKVGPCEFACQGDAVACPRGLLTKDAFQCSDPGCPAAWECVDTKTDPNNCGGCGTPCAGACVGGACRAADTEILAAVSGVTELALDTSYVYFVSGTSLSRVPKAGGAVHPLATIAGGMSKLKVVNGAAFVRNGAKLLRVPAAGGTPQTVFDPSDADPTRAIIAPPATDGVKVFWAEQIQDAGQNFEIIYRRKPIAGGPTVDFAEEAPASFQNVTFTDMDVLLGTLMFYAPSSLGSTSSSDIEFLDPNGTGESPTVGTSNHDSLPVVNATAWFVYDVLDQSRYGSVSGKIPSSAQALPDVYSNEDGVPVGGVMVPRAANSRYVYVTAPAAGAPTASYLLRLNLCDPAVTPLPVALRGPTNFGAVRADETHLYWAAPGGIHVLPQ